MSLWLMLAVNDYRNGMHTGRVEHIELGDGEFLDLECNVTSGQTCRCLRVSDGGKPDQLFIQIGRRRFPVLSYRQWLGNMCWDGALVTESTAAVIANYLRKNGKWTPVGGAVDIGEKWDSGKAFTGRDFENAEG